MKVIHGSRSGNDETTMTDETTDFKTCPVCGAVCFADMDICFGCLHRFDGSVASKAELQNVIDHASGKGTVATTDRTIREETHPTASPAAERTPDRTADHTQDIARPEKQTSLRTAEEENRTFPADDGLTSHHICSDKDGRQFEISISIKLL